MNNIQIITSFVIGFAIFVFGFYLCTSLGNQDITSTTIAVLFLASVISAFDYALIVHLKNKETH